MTSAPPVRYAHAMAFDPTCPCIVMFGGQGSTVLGDTWTWDGSSWSQVTPASLSPPPRFGHAMAFDAVRGATILFGPNSDTWELRRDGASRVFTWTPLSTQSPAFSGSMAYDRAREQMVMVEGFGATGIVGVPAPLWTFRYESTAPAETCRFGFDGDGDQRLACADPDCWGYCTPFCPPTLPTCDPTLPHCGDATCDAIEDCRSCPADCGPCAAVCGDFVCDPPESSATCPGDCH
jgi:hypothetical protein